MEGIIDFCINLVKEGGYEGIFIGMFLEGTTLPLPIEEVVLPLSGYFVFKGDFSFILVVLFGSIGTTVGNLLMYYIARHLGLPFIIKYERYLFIDKNHLEKGFKIFEKHGPLIVSFGRLAPGIRGFIPLVAGVSRMNPLLFVSFTFLGSIAYVSILTSIGYALGEKWETAIEYMKYNQYVFIVFFVAFILFIIYDIKKNRPFHRDVHKKVYRKTKDVIDNKNKKSK